MIGIPSYLFSSVKGVELYINTFAYANELFPSFSLKNMTE